MLSSSEVSLSLSYLHPAGRSVITFGRLPSFPRRIILPLGRQSDCVFARPVILISGLAVDEGNGDDDDEDLPSILSATTPSLATARTEMQRALS